MIKKQVKCPRCGKVLLRLYSTAVKSVTCSCGYTTNLKHKEALKDNHADWLQNCTPQRNSYCLP